MRNFLAYVVVWLSVLNEQLVPEVLAERPKSGFDSPSSTLCYSDKKDRNKRNSIKQKEGHFAKSRCHTEEERLIDRGMEMAPKSQSFLGISRGSGFFYKFAREVRSQFSSELEALTLQLTRPTDVPADERALKEYSACFLTEFENPQLVVSMLMKLSRKLHEPYLYTKLKSLYCLHRLAISSNVDSASALYESIKSLRKEVDSKNAAVFFDTEVLLKVSKIPWNSRKTSPEDKMVAALLPYYSTYLFGCIDRRGEEAQLIAKTASPKCQRAMLKGLSDLIQALNMNIKLEELLHSSFSHRKRLAKARKRPLPGVKGQILIALQSDRVWILRHMAYVFSRPFVSLSDPVAQRAEAILKKEGRTFKTVVKAKHRKLGATSPSAAIVSQPLDKSLLDDENLGEIGHLDLSAAQREQEIESLTQEISELASDFSTDATRNDDDGDYISEVISPDTSSTGQFGVTETIRKAYDLAEQAIQEEEGSTEETDVTNDDDGDLSSEEDHLDEDFDDTNEHEDDNDDISSSREIVNEDRCSDGSGSSDDNGPGGVGVTVSRKKHVKTESSLGNKRKKGPKT